MRDPMSIISPHNRTFDRSIRELALIITQLNTENSQAYDEALHADDHRDAPRMLTKTPRRFRISNPHESDSVQQRPNRRSRPKLTDPARYAAPEQGPLGRCLI